MKKYKFDPSLPLRYIRYARMSTGMQNPRSPDQQLNAVAHVLSRLGYSWVHVDDYRDDALTGRLMRNRPGFCQLMADIKTGRLVVDVILVDMLERFGRMEELADLRRNLQNHFGVFILTADSSFTDPTSVAGQALGVVESIRATTIGHAKANDVRRGKIDAAKLGHWPGGPAQRGIKLESVMKPNTQPAEVSHRIVVPNSDEAPVIDRFFALGDRNGWGGFRIASHLNADEEFVAKYGKVSGSTVNYILDNPIYKGTLRFKANTTLIVDDRRITIPNDPADIVYVEGFCQPIIDPAVWNRVQAVRQQRSAKMKSVRARNRKPNGKQIKPLASGVVLKNPLTGLIRCATCGCSMRPNRSGGARYFYYGCPLYYDRRCTNGRKVRGDWLWKVFIDFLRERLFPLPDPGDQALPGWASELMSAVRSELERLFEQKGNRRPILERERADLESQIAGWSQSLANPSLSQAVRRRIEEDWNRTVARQQHLEAELDGLEHESKRVDDLLREDVVIERLHRLYELLQDGNPTAINLELARHVEAIYIHPDGRVVIRANRLGIFEGLTETLARPADEAEPSPDASSDANGGNSARPRKALLKRRSVDLDLKGTIPFAAAPLSLMSVKLPDRWVVEEVVTMPKRHAWAHLNAEKVRRKRDETEWSQQKLADFFGVTTPTIRHALKLATDSGNGD